MALATKLVVKDIVECRIYGRNQTIDKIIRWCVPKKWREKAWHLVALIRAKNGWIERHTRGRLEHYWMEKRSD